MLKFSFTLLIVLALLLTRSSCSATQPQSDIEEMIRNFVSENIKIDWTSIDKFFIKVGSQMNRFNVEIQSRRKKVNLVLSHLVNAEPRLKIIFMEEIARFGNEKSFLNIRTSKGKNQDENEMREKVKNNKNTGNDNSDTLNDEQKLVKWPEINNFQNLYLKRVMKYIQEQLPKASLETMRLINSLQSDKYLAHVQIEKIPHEITIEKQLVQNHEKLKLSKIKKLDYLSE